MHTVLLTLVALGVGPGDDIQKAPGPEVHAGCDTCADGGHASCLATHRALKQQRHMMPQSCYDPVYGCYRGSRFMNRYPAFHGTYYRRPYNYRNVFDYPWHAELHEPTSLYSYNVAGETGMPVPAMPNAPERAPQEAAPPTPPPVIPTQEPEARTSRLIEDEPIQLGPIGTGVQAESRTRTSNNSRNSRRRVRTISAAQLRR